MFLEKIYLGIGGNIGNREDNLELAKLLIEERVGSIFRTSSLYETAAWGVEEQPDFLNQVLEVTTRLSASEVLTTILDIEKQMGRTRTQKWYARSIDIDLLFYGDKIIEEENLIVPHPFIGDRNFVLIPLNELQPNFLHPKHQKTIAELLANCPDTLGVRQVGHGSLI